MPFRTFNSWLFDGQRYSPIPKPKSGVNLLKYNSPITHTFLVSMFLRHSRKTIRLITERDDRAVYRLHHNAFPGCSNQVDQPVPRQTVPDVSLVASLVMRAATGMACLD